MSLYPQLEVTASYGPGNWVAFAGPNTWLLLDAEPDEPIVSEAWGLLRREADSTSLVDLMTKRAVERASSFALAVSSEIGVTISLGGTAVADLQDDESPVHLTCPELTRLAEYHLAIRPQRLQLGGGTVSQRSKFPLESGIASAALLILRWLYTETVATQTESSIEPAADALRDEAAAPSQPVDAVLAFTQVGAEPASSFEATPADEPIPAAATLPAPPDHSYLIDAVEPGTESQAESANGDGAGAYDHLFGQTMVSSVDAAAIRPEEDDESALRHRGDVATEEQSAIVDQLVTRAVPATHNTSKDAVTPGLADAGLIESIPWSDSPRLSEERSANIPDPDDAGLTVNREVQAALLEKLSGAASLRIPSPLVHAVRCPSQHPNPANSGICRVCGSPISEQVAVTVPRPVLGRLELSTGDSVTLDRGVVLGRGPSWNRPVEGERPHLVKLPSPESDISRDHLEVRLDGWHVLVVDLNSTNGTVITRPGTAPERLRPDQPTMIEPGTIVSLANEVSFTYYPTA